MPAHCHKNAHLARWNYIPFGMTWRFERSSLVWISSEYRSWGPAWNFIQRQVYFMNIFQCRECDTLTLSAGEHTNPQSGSGHTSSHNWRRMGRKPRKTCSCCTTICGFVTYTRARLSWLIGQRPVLNWTHIIRSQFHNDSCRIRDITIH